MADWGPTMGPGTASRMGAGEEPRLKGIRLRVASRGKPRDGEPQGGRDRGAAQERRAKWARATGMHFPALILEPQWHEFVALCGLSSTRIHPRG